jgi:hypothetical protein
MKITVYGGIKTIGCAHEVMLRTMSSFRNSKTGKSTAERHFLEGKLRI